MHTVKVLQSSSSCTKKTMMKEFGMKEESALFYNVALCVCVCVYVYVCDIYTVFDWPAYGPYPFCY
jgi:hypothetical protein